MNNEVVEKTEIKVENGISKEIVKPRELFSSIVGQIPLKRKIGFYLNGYLQSKTFPNSIYISAKGQGKSSFCKETAKGLIEFSADGSPIINPKTGLPKRKTYLEINCSTIKNISEFINTVLVPYVDRPFTLFMDEASQLESSVMFSLLTMLNPSDSGRNLFVHGDYQCEIDFTKHTFLFATSEPASVFHALMNRLTRFDLQPYTNQQLMDIIQKNTPKVIYEEGTLFEISTLLRHNARLAVLFARDIKTYLKGSTTFLKDDLIELRKILGTFPLGLNQSEISVLKFLAEKPYQSLTCLAAKMGMTNASLQKDIELFLLSNGLMEIQSAKGRSVSLAGRMYLKNLSELGLT
jgi:Holliday junction resolvasome RuvABC ATP-dependent DNA helicase subunit